MGEPFQASYAETSLVQLLPTARSREEREARMLTEGTGYGRMPGARLEDLTCVRVWSGGLRVSCCIFLGQGM